MTSKLLFENVVDFSAYTLSLKCLKTKNRLDNAAYFVILRFEIKSDLNVFKTLKIDILDTAEVTRSFAGRIFESTTPGKGERKLIEIDENFCKGCEICIEFCPLKVFDKSDKLNRKGYYLPVIVKEDECVGCRLCELLCPEFAIIITNE